MISNAMNTRTGRATTIRAAPDLSRAGAIKAVPLNLPDDITSPNAIRAWRRGVGDARDGKRTYESPYKLKYGVCHRAYLRGMRAVIGPPPPKVKITAMNR